MSVPTTSANRTSPSIKVANGEVKVPDGAISVNCYCFFVRKFSTEKLRFVQKISTSVNPLLGLNIVEMREKYGK